MRNKKIQMLFVALMAMCTEQMTHASEDLSPEVDSSVAVGATETTTVEDDDQAHFLIALSQHPFRSVDQRIRSITKLGNLGCKPQTMIFLNEIIKNADSDVRLKIEAIRVLDQFGMEINIDILRSIFEKCPKDLSSYNSVSSILSKHVRDYRKEVIDILLKLELGVFNPSVLLATLDEGYKQIMIDRFKTEYRERNISLVDTIKGLAGLGQVREAADWMKRSIGNIKLLLSERIEAMGGLGALGGDYKKEAFDYLVRWYRSLDYGFDKILVAKALGDLGESEEAAVILKGIAFNSGEAKKVRLEAVKELANLGKDYAQEVLSRMKPILLCVSCMKYLNDKMDAAIFLDDLNTRESSYEAGCIAWRLLMDSPGLKQAEDLFKGLLADIQSQVIDDLVTAENINEHITKAMIRSAHHLRDMNALCDAGRVALKIVQFSEGMEMTAKEREAQDLFDALPQEIKDQLTYIFK